MGDIPVMSLPRGPAFSNSMHNSKASPSLFDSFNTLPPAAHPNQGVPIANPPPQGALPAPAAPPRSAAKHPNAAYELAGVDSLANQLAGTNLNSSPSAFPRRTGVVKFFNSTKGFGFIWDNNSAELGEVDIFVHWTTIQGEASFKSLGEGEIVEYELARGPKGLQALNVTGPGRSGVQGDPLARMPLSLARNRLIPAARFGHMSIPIPIQPVILPSYAHASAAQLDPIYAAYLQGQRYMAQPQAAFLPMSGHSSRTVTSNSSFSNVSQSTQNSARQQQPQNANGSPPPNAYSQYLAASSNGNGRGIGEGQNGFASLPSPGAQRVSANHRQQSDASRLPAYLKTPSDAPYQGGSGPLSPNGLNRIGEPAGSVSRSGDDENSFGPSIWGRGSA